MHCQKALMVAMSVGQTVGETAILCVVHTIVLWCPGRKGASINRPLFLLFSTPDSTHKKDMFNFQMILWLLGDVVVWVMPACLKVSTC